MEWLLKLINCKKTSKLLLCTQSKLTQHIAIYSMGHKKMAAGYDTANKHAINNGYYNWGNSYKFTFDSLDGDEAVRQEDFLQR